MSCIAQSKLASVTLIALCQVAAMALWFSASAAVPSLVAQFHLTPFMQAALTSGVQAGFVIGCLVSALLGLPDRVDPRRLFAISAVQLGSMGQSAQLELFEVHGMESIRVGLCKSVARVVYQRGSRS